MNDGMTIATDTDTKRAHRGAQPALPFSEEELATNGPRLRPAELARLLGVSRQTVHVWLKAGKATLGADGRLDPRKAVADVLKAGDPARLRARVLAPFAEEIAAGELADQSMRSQGRMCRRAKRATAMRQPGRMTWPACPTGATWRRPKRGLLRLRARPAGPRAQRISRARALVLHGLE